MDRNLMSPDLASYYDQDLPDSAGILVPNGLLACAPAQGAAMASLDERQQVVIEWGKTAFGPDHMADKIVRAARFIEEAAELVQAVGLPRDHLQRAVDHVYSRPAGDLAQEAGGSANTLMALCGALGLSLDQCQQAEIARCLAKDPAHFAARNQVKLREVDAASLPGSDAVAREREEIADLIREWSEKYSDCGASALGDKLLDLIRSRPAPEAGGAAQVQGEPQSSPIGQSDVAALKHLADSMGFGRTHDMLRRVIAATPYLSASPHQGNSSDGGSRKQPFVPADAVGETSAPSDHSGKQEGRTGTRAFAHAGQWGASETVVPMLAAFAQAEIAQTSAGSADAEACLDNYANENQMLHDRAEAAEARLAEAVEALKLSRNRIDYLGTTSSNPRDAVANVEYFFPPIDRVLARVG